MNLWTCITPALSIWPLHVSFQTLTKKSRRTSFRPVVLPDYEEQPFENPLHYKNFYQRHALWNSPNSRHRVSKATKRLCQAITRYLR
ncbi:hypothetical protein HOLleu_35543 [Holothuria leucospilota]|uniref:Uncharacterized protein n=1 Tax=Holothuria leucospilota TaxID=206669 RepID=A0A9Q1BD13_HOLLE|nr:hypothetical protein HOLleu_35543 [Holothuria leucospilota]